MAYIGSQPTVGLVTKLSDIASSFNGILTTFQLSIPPGGAGNSFTPGSAFQIIVSLGGVIQNPATDYTLSGSQITFTTAPAAGLTCFILALGQSINVGTPGAGTVTTSSFGTLTSIPLTGATSGTTTIQAPAVAGNNTLTLPTSNGSANQFLKNGATAGSLGYSSVVEDSSGRLLVGTSTARTSANGVSAGLQVEGTGAESALSIIRNGGLPYLTLGRSGGGSVGSNTAISNNDELGRISWAAADGTDIQSWAAQISAEIDGIPGSNDTPGRLVFSTTADGAPSPTERLRIQSSGDLRIANSTTFYPATDNAVSLGSGPTGPFRFSAVWAANGTIQTSDERDKTEIVDAQLGSDFIKALRPVSYKWIEGGKVDTGKRDEDGNYIYESVPGTRIHWGFIAQEVKQVVDSTGVDFGGWVLTDKDDPDSQQALRYDQFIAPLTKALQETMAELEALKAEVAALKGK